ncbi:MAG TPA: type II secretion system F family protein [Methanocella sp.]|nr:type II secretion system F family protein [Methanocella sp.]
MLALRAEGCRSNYERCRPDREFGDWMYLTILLSLATFMAADACAGLFLFFTGAPVDALTLALIPLSGVGIATLAYYARAFSVKSMKDYRGALIDASLVHAIGFMLTMAESNVPLKNMFENISNLGGVYGKDIALEAAHILSLTDEVGMDVVSALRKAQSASPSAAWRELLIGIAEVYGSGGSLNEYLKGKYQALTERKLMDVKKYNESIQGLSSIYLSIVGIASIFISLINLVFNMAGWLSNDSFVWLDALAIVPLGSFIVIRMMRATNPEA